MPSIQPNGTVRLCANIPWDSTYTDVRKFGSAGEQSSYISSKAVATFLEVSYQRPTSTVTSQRPPYTCRVDMVADDLYNCNYMMFQNTNFGSKWFYAFVKEVNYINPNCTEIVYELDHYQTWCFDYTVLPSFVLREHAETDELYENLQPEPFDNLERICTTINTYRADSTNYKIIICTATDQDGKVVEGQIVDNVYSGLKFIECTDANQANVYLTAYAVTGKLDSVVSVFMSPYSVLSPPQAQQVSLQRPTTIGNYTPKNKKLLTYPYISVQVSNNNGNVKEYFYEKFTTISDTKAIMPIDFDIYCLAGYKPSIIAVPAFYDSDTTVQGRGNPDAMIESTDFPICGWSGNVFANYLATTFSKDILNTIMSLAGVVGSALIGNVGGGVVTGLSAVGNVANTVNNFRINYNNQGKAMATPVTSAFNFKTDTVGITFKQMAIRQSIAESIDNYFEMYGYACNQLKVPNEDSRESWNYVKCDNVVIQGSLPVDAIETVKAMYNNGVRFWHTDSVGNYSLSNGVINNATV